MTRRNLVAIVAVVPWLILLLPALAVGLLMHGFVLAVRGVGRLLEPRFMPWTGLIQFDKALGWKPKPNMDTHYLALDDDIFHVVTDEEGWAGRRRLDDSRIVVIGDSFAFGYGVDTRHSFAEVNPSLGVKGIGAPGYSMVQGVLLMEQLGRRLRDKLVVWFVFLENDLQDNLTPEMRLYRTPFVKATPRGWEIVTRHLKPEKWECSNLVIRRLMANFCVPGPLADRAYDACDYLVERADEACRAAGAQLLVVTIPYPMQLTSEGRAVMARRSGAPALFDAGLPDKRIAAVCARHGVESISGRDFLTIAHYKQREGMHWNRRGHRRVARLLAEAYARFTAETRNNAGRAFGSRPGSTMAAQPTGTEF